jgi:hypothetical protein
LEGVGAGGEDAQEEEGRLGGVAEQEKARREAGVFVVPSFR